MREFKGLPKLKGKSNDKGRHILKGWERPPLKNQKTWKVWNCRKSVQYDSTGGINTCRVKLRVCEKVCVCVYSTELIRKVCVVDLAEEPIGKS